MAAQRERDDLARLVLRSRRFQTLLNRIHDAQRLSTTAGQKRGSDSVSPDQ
jgi:hypothetical protein